MTSTLTRDRPKEAPGPGPTPVALLRALDLTIGRRIHGTIPGDFRAHDLGGGLELAQIRPYQPGDDVRRIDWNVTARTTVPHVRVHVPERALTSWLVLETIHYTIYTCNLLLFNFKYCWCSQSNSKGLNPIYNFQLS